MSYRVGIIGLGYVGLPLAVEIGKKFPTIGFDINQGRIDELRSGADSTLEVDARELQEAEHLSFSMRLEDLEDCDFYIVTVPTPVDKAKKPDLTPLVKASETVSSVLSKGNIVVYESTVFPGCTEEVCVPILEQSGLVFNQDFFCGYSPERINPGDKSHRLPNIRKITSGSTDEIALKVDAFYATFITAGTFTAQSIKVAEAAKVIENAQRDINIAFVNELAMIFNRMDLDTLEVLEAAGTKWNFLPFKPGLVGGHCIGVDPYYLTYKAEELGYHPQMILAGRQINDGMGSYVAKETVKQIIRSPKFRSNAKVLVMGFTFKENCPDVRNTRVVDIVEELEDYGLSVDVFDPVAEPKEVEAEYGIRLAGSMDGQDYLAIIVAVAHTEFLSLPWQDISKSTSMIFDIKGILPKEVVNSRL